MNVAGSPTSVRMPAVLPTSAHRITGVTKSTSSARASRIMIGAVRITVVALGRNAQIGAIMTIRPIR